MVNGSDYNGNNVRWKFKEDGRHFDTISANCTHNHMFKLLVYFV